MPSEQKRRPVHDGQDGAYIFAVRPALAAVRAAARTGATGRAGTHGTHGTDIAENLVEQAAMTAQRRGLVAGRRDVRDLL